MLRFILVYLGILISYSSFSQDMTYSLMPVPRSVKAEGDGYRIFKTF